MKRGIWPAFLAVTFIVFGLLGLWDMTWLAFKTLDLVRSQFIEEPLKPPAAPTWADPNAVGYPIRDIPIEKDSGVMALGVNNAGDYAPLIMQNDGAVRAAGKWRDEKTGKDHWIAIQVDPQGRVICSPKSFPGLKLAPGEVITIHGPPAKGQP